MRYGTEKSNEIPDTLPISHLINFYSKEDESVVSERLSFDSFCLIVLPKYKYRLLSKGQASKWAEDAKKATFQEPPKDEALFGVARVFEKEYEFFELRLKYLQSFERIFLSSSGIDYTKLFVQVDSSRSGQVN